MEKSVSLSIKILVMYRQKGKLKHSQIFIAVCRFPSLPVKAKGNLSHTKMLYWIMAVKVGQTVHLDLTTWHPYSLYSTFFHPPFGCFPSTFPLFPQSSLDTLHTFLHPLRFLHPLLSPVTNGAEYSGLPLYLHMRSVQSLYKPIFNCYNPGPLFRASGCLCHVSHILCLYNLKWKSILALALYNYLLRYVC